MTERPPREPERYTRTDHFQDVLDDPLRFLTEEMVELTIRDGLDYPNQGGPGKLRRKKDFGGVLAVLVLPMSEPVVVTGWTEVGDWVKALSSGVWEQDQLARIRAFEDEEHKRRPTYHVNK